MEESISWWFQGLNAGLATLPEDAPFFRACAENCLGQGTLDFYLKLKADTGGTPDAFFAALSRIEGLDAEILESDRMYRLIFCTCTCCLHNCGYVQAPQTVLLLQSQHPVGSGTPLAGVLRRREDGGDDSRRRRSVQLSNLPGLRRIYRLYRDIP